MFGIDQLDYFCSVMEQSTTTQISCSNSPKIPIEKHPSARFSHLGPKALSDAELLSLLFNHVSKKHDAVEISRQLIQKFGGICELGALSIKQLAEEFGMNTSNAIRLLAAFEFSARCAGERMNRIPMNSAETIYKSISPRLAYKNNEYVLIILVDSRLQALRIVELSKGNSNAALCEPRDVLHQVIINQSSAFILVHNHPSGDPSPSRQDLTLTKKVQQASEFMHVRFVDHIIIRRPGENRQKAYYSFTEAGAL